MFAFLRNSLFLFIFLTLVATNLFVFSPKTVSLRTVTEVISLSPLNLFDPPAFFILAQKSKITLYSTDSGEWQKLLSRGVPKPKGGGTAGFKCPTDEKSGEASLSYNLCICICFICVFLYFQQHKRNWGRPPLLTVPTTRRPKSLPKREPSRKAQKEAVWKEVDGVSGVVRESLSKHAERRAEAADKMEEDDSDIQMLAVGEEEVEKVKELGIDRARKGNKGVKSNKSKSSFGDMLKTGLNTLNTIQTMSKVFGGNDAGDGGNNVMMNLVGSLLTGGEGGKGTKSKKGAIAKNPLDPLVDSAFDLLGGEEATGGLRRFAKPFLKNLIQNNS